MVTSCPRTAITKARIWTRSPPRRERPPSTFAMQIVRDGGAGVVCKSMIDADIETFYRQPWVMVSSDGGIGMRHPQARGPFRACSGDSCANGTGLSLEEAIRKMSAFPAQRLADRPRARQAGNEGGRGRLRSERGDRSVDDDAADDRTRRGLSRAGEWRVGLWEAENVTGRGRAVLHMSRSGRPRVTNSACRETRTDTAPRR